MRVAVTGSTGFIGSALVPALRGDGHDVVRLVRRAAQQPDEVAWDPAGHSVDTAALGAVDAVVHLAGVNIGGRRWNEAHKQAVLSSRVDGTTTVARTLAALSPQPRVLLSASAIGWYGATGDHTVTEKDPSGEGFSAEVVRRWEASTAPAEDAGIRTVHLRSGLVLSPDGGSLGRMLPLFKAGIGGPLGSGRQYWSWITLADEVAAIRFLLSADDVRGPVNLTAPTPVTNAEFTRVLGRVLHRPAVLPVPAVALRLVLGGFADEGVLISQRVQPAVLEAAGYPFIHTELEPALRAVLA